MSVSIGTLLLFLLPFAMLGLAKSQDVRLRTGSISFRWALLLLSVVSFLGPCYAQALRIVSSDTFIL